MKQTLKIIGFGFFLFFILALQAETVHPGLQVFKGKHGGAIIVRPRNNTDLVAIKLFVKAGSMTEAPYLGSGISHLLEHLCFKGTEEERMTPLAEAVQKMGGRINAYTSYLETVYEMNVPSEKLSDALKLMQDLVLKTSFTGEDVEKEKMIIQREMDMVEDNHDRYLSRLFWETIYDQCPAKYPVIGIKEIFQKLTLEDVLNYYRQRYVSENMALVLVGNVNLNENKETLLSFFPESVSAPVPFPDYWFEPRQIEPKWKQEGRKHLTYQKAMMGWKTVDLFHLDSYALDVLAQILGGMRSAFIQEELVQTGKLLNGGAFSFVPEYPGFFGIQFSFDEGDFDEKTEEINVLVEKIKKNEVTPEAIKKAISQSILSLHTYIEDIDHEAGVLGSNYLSTGIPNYADHWLTQIRSVTPKKVREMAEKYLTSQTKTLVSIIPEVKQKEVESLKDSEGSEPELAVLPSGLKLILLPDASRSLVHVHWTGYGGAMAEKPENFGISSLLNSVYGMASESLSRIDVNTLLDLNGAEIEGFSGNNSMGMSLLLMPDQLNDVWPAFLSLLSAPAFERENIANMKQKLLIQQKAAQENPMQRAMIETRKMLYGDHAYGRYLGGEESKLNKIEQSDLETFFNSTFDWNQGVLSIMGNFDKSALKKLLQETNFKNIKKKPYFPETPKPFTETQTLTIPLETNQTVVVYSFKTVSMKEEDAVALDLLGTYLTGFMSPLFKTIREEEGLAYITGADSSCNLTDGHFSFYAATEGASWEDVAEKIELVIKGLVEKPMTSERFESVRNYFLGQELRSISDLKSLSFSSALNELYGLGYDYYKKRTNIIRDLTAERIRAVAEKYFKNKPFTKVVTGKLK